jgi:hypothetical protein
MSLEIVCSLVVFVSKDTSSRGSRMEEALRLKSMKSVHKERSDSALRSATTIVQELGKMFDDYLGRVLSDLEEEIRILETAYFDLSEERTRTEEVRAKFKDVKMKMDRLLQRSRDGEIVSFEYFDFDTVRRAWDLMLEVEELRSRIDRRYSRKHVHDIETFKDLLDQALKERGL